ncbi:hypothetical protein RchiOBHm_Chr7g0186501 [Rosa chinensis]|uniref:Uncharacterized protein n=1 Tax=Rosa chinensis TaxID=74649 RepID=A0A2P6P3Y9_ROSCH|nr:hypothetical protein RchiOBHm_Chr7g0186501 [Rosa chinensis]
MIISETPRFQKALLVLGVFPTDSGSYAGGNLVFPIKSLDHLDSSAIFHAIKNQVARCLCPMIVTNSSETH